MNACAPAAPPGPDCAVFSESSSSPPQPASSATDRRIASTRRTAGNLSRGVAAARQPLDQPPDAVGRLLERLDAAVQLVDARADLAQHPEQRVERDQELPEPGLEVAHRLGQIAQRALERDE